MRLALTSLLLALAACSAASVEGGSSGASSATSTTGSGSSSGSTAGSTSGTHGTSSSGGTTSAASTSGSGGTSASGDTFLPWEGGPSYYAQWPHAPSSDPSSFPIAVWLQSPPNAPGYAAIGINTFIGLYQGPTDDQIAGLDAVSMPTICDQDVDWANHISDPLIQGWQQEDEPDNAQSDGNGGYGPCVDPSVIQQTATTFRANDSTRPVYLNLGQGTAWAAYYGRGDACAGVDDYAQYALGADILSFDIYPVNSTDAPVQNNLYFVAMGVDHLRTASNDLKPVWTWIETTGQQDPSATPTPAQIRAEVWMALVHGARGIGYFAHIFAPTFVEDGLLTTAASKTAVQSIDAEIVQLAPALNAQPLANGATVASSNTAVPVDLRASRVDGTLYVFAVAMRDDTTSATFTVRTPTRGTVTVINESRTLPLANGTFVDQFAGYGVHLYEISP